MVQNVNIAQQTPDSLSENVEYFLPLRDCAGAEIRLPFRFGDMSLDTAQDFVILRDRNKLAVLQNLQHYPAVSALTDLTRTREALAALETSLQDIFVPGRGVYIFGAHKVGAKMARLCAQRGLTVKGFIDNDVKKQGKKLDEWSISAPKEIKVSDDIVVIGSGHYSNEILRQTAAFDWPLVLNMHQLFFALQAHHGAESDFRRFSSVLHTDAYRLISAFLALDDDQSRKIFDGLIAMRATLDTRIADEFKSPFQDEYLDSQFIQKSDAAYYVDAGAFTGDTLERLETRFGTVSHAYMFEPELPPYYEGLKKFSSRNNVFFYNFGLAREYAKFAYQPDLSCDLLNEIENRIPNDITSFIQAVKLDDVLTGPVTMFKLDIEGAEASALQGAAETIRKQRPKLCVCAYHRADDLWKLIDTVKQINGNYKIGLRHYADILEDTSFYFY